MAKAKEVAKAYATVMGEDTLHKASVYNPDVRELARMTDAIIARSIKDRRRQARISETKFADRLHKTRGFVRLVEAERHSLTLTEFKEVAEALGIDHLEFARDIFSQVYTASHAFTILS